MLAPGGAPGARVGVPRPSGGRRRAPVWTLLVIAAAIVVAAGAVVVGADTMWLVALGDAVLRTGQLPAALPFAVADTRGWAAVPTMGALLLSAGACLINCVRGVA